MKLGNTIVATNTNAGGEFILASDVGGNFTSLGHNLIGISVPGAWLASDIVGTELLPREPAPGPLANNGGPTKTLAVSPFAGAAYNEGSNALAAQYGLTTDQRGQPRVQNSTVDIGAYETKFSLMVI